MALQDALTNVPGLAGYLAKQQYDQQQQAGALQQLLGVANLVETQRHRQQQAEAQRQQMEMAAQTLAMRVAEEKRKENARQELATKLGSFFPPSVTGGALSEALGGGPTRVETPDPRNALLQGLVHLDPSGISDIAKTVIGGGRSGVGAGVDPMIVRVHEAADKAEAEGKTELAQQLRTYAARLAPGFTSLQAGRYSGNDYQSRLQYGRAIDEGITGLPAPGSVPIPGAQTAPSVVPRPAPSAPNTGDVQFPSNGRSQGLPGTKTQEQILNEELIAERAKGNTAAVAAIEKELASIRGNAVNTPQGGKPKTEERFLPSENGNRMVTIRRVGNEERAFFNGRDVTSEMLPRRTPEDVKQQRQQLQDLRTRSEVMSNLDKLEMLVKIQSGQVAGPYNWIGGVTANVGNVFGGDLQSPASRASQLVESIITGMEKLGSISNKEGDSVRATFGIGQLSGSSTKVQNAIDLYRGKVNAKFSGADVSSGRTQTGGATGNFSEDSSEDRELLNRYRRK